MMVMLVVELMPQLLIIRLLAWIKQYRLIGIILLVLVQLVEELQLLLQLLAPHTIQRVLVNTVQHLELILCLNDRLLLRELPSLLL